MGGKTHHIPPHGDVVLKAPAEGWSWPSYERAILDFTRVRGRAPRSVTMHPETLEILGLTPHDKLGELERALAILKVKASHVHDRDTIVLADRHDDGD